MAKKPNYILFPHEVHGFDGTKDFCSTLLGLKYKRIYMWDFLTVAAGLVSGFITKYVWSDRNQFEVVLILVLADVFLGSHLAWKNKKFQTRKFTRSLWVLVYYTIAMAVVHNFAKLNPEFKLFVPVIFYWLAGKTFLSVLKNLSLLGVPLPPKIRQLVMEKIDVFKNDDEVKPKDKTPKDETEEA